MPKQVTLDSLELKGLNIFKEAGKLRVEANYSILAGTEVYKAGTRDVSDSLPPATVDGLASAWDAIVGLIKASESI
ncbi:MAG: hypothetical protein HY671_15250 [Chloroflexi bacterium]|nr:hypothetical protein [Chloroflexota bacterium]